MLAYKNRYSILYKVIALAIVCLFLVNDAAWAQNYSNFNPSNTTLAAQSRLKPFFEKRGLDFQNMTSVIYAAGKLKELLFNQTSLDDVKIRREINRLNRLFPDGAVKIEEEVQSHNLGGKAYRYAVFHFAKTNNPINVWTANEKSVPRN